MSTARLGDNKRSYEKYNKKFLVNQLKTVHLFLKGARLFQPHFSFKMVTSILTVFLGSIISTHPFLNFVSNWSPLYLTQEQRSFFFLPQRPQLPKLKIDLMTFLMIVRRSINTELFRQLNHLRKQN